MIYLKWKLSNGVSGTGPEKEIHDRGGLAEAGWAVDADGYRIGYLIEGADLTGLETWDVTEVTETEAVAFCQELSVGPAELFSDGHIGGGWNPYQYDPDLIGQSM